ncbi:hypothetical protein BGZ51_001479 [Haplosporangium sp. Z 767]|nr:hypothetical protein BGZ50_004946 [Haplosporangium sp. Z 11]KAF9187220.1 hypothetical protein BGZ51_001479 [Haplosporangium sp. Z 767]
MALNDSQNTALLPTTPPSPPSPPLALSSALGSTSLLSGSTSNLTTDSTEPSSASEASSPPSPPLSLTPSNSTTTSLTSTSIVSDHTDKYDSDQHDDNNNNILTRKTEAPPKKRSKNGYVARVGFDTFGCEDTTEYAYTLQARTDNWNRTKTTRTFLVGTDTNEYSAHALQWVMENMVEEGDEIVALRVVPMELRDSFAKYGVPSFQGHEISARIEAIKIMDMIREKNNGKEINIVVECLVGNVRDTIQHMIKMYEPDMLVVGTRGRNSVKGFLLGSVSRYCLNHSPVPVTVVRPAEKLIKSKTKVKGIFRRRTSAVQSETSVTSLEEDTPPQVFFSSPLSRQTSRSSLDASHADSTTLPKVLEGLELDRKRTKSLEPVTTEPVPMTAAAKASAAKRSSIFSTLSTFSTPSLTVVPPTPASSIQSSLSYASALLSSDDGSGERPPPPEGMIKLTKSLTTDGISSWSSSSSSKKESGRRGFGKLSGAMLLGPLSLGGIKKKPGQA